MCTRIRIADIPKEFTVELGWKVVRPRRDMKGLTTTFAGFPVTTLMVAENLFAPKYVADECTGPFLDLTSEATHFYKEPPAEYFSYHTGILCPVLAIGVLGPDERRPNEKACMAVEYCSRYGLALSHSYGSSFSVVRGIQDISKGTYGCDLETVEEAKRLMEAIALWYPETVKP